MSIADQMKQLRALRLTPIPHGESDIEGDYSLQKTALRAASEPEGDS